MLEALVILLAGFLALLKGADWLVEGSCSIARRFRISEWVIGLTLVSFGTSLPEFFINIASRIQGEGSISLGDVLGSNIANILLVLGSASAIRALRFKKSVTLIEIPFALILSVVLYAVAAFDAKDAFRGLSRPDGILLLSVFSGFLFYIHRIRHVGGDEIAASQEVVNCDNIVHSLLKAAIGMPALALGSKAVVHGAVTIASSLGVPEGIVGLTLIAIGTSLPELATSITASLKGRSHMAVGNVIGSNIFNIGWILGISSVVSPWAIPAEYVQDMLFVIAATVVLFVTTLFSKSGAIGRVSGVLFMVLYAGYTAHLAARVP